MTKQDKWPNIKVVVRQGAPKDPGPFPTDEPEDKQVEWVKNKAAFIIDKMFKRTEKVKA